MKGQQVILSLALFSLTGCQHSLVRDTMPTLTRTGEVKDVVIREDVSPATLTVNSGDEIRWVNKRQGDVRVIFLTPVMENLSCERNFGGGILGPNRNEYTAKLGSNDTASVCFRNSGEVKYVVRAASNDPSGEQNLPGTITIGSEDQARRSAPPDTSERRSAQMDHPTSDR